MLSKPLLAAAAVVVKEEEEEEEEEEEAPVGEEAKAASFRLLSPASSSFKKEDCDVGRQARGNLVLYWGRGGKLLVGGGGGSNGCKDVSLSEQCLPIPRSLLFLPSSLPPPPLSSSSPPVREKERECQRNITGFVPNV